MESWRPDLELGGRVELLVQRELEQRGQRVGPCEPVARHQVSGALAALAELLRKGAARVVDLHLEQQPAGLEVRGTM